MGSSQCRAYSHSQLRRQRIMLCHSKYLTLVGYIALCYMLSLVFVLCSYKVTVDELLAFQACHGVNKLSFQDYNDF